MKHKKAPDLKRIKNMQIIFLIFFILLQIGLYYENGYLSLISFSAGFFLGIYWIYLLIKKFSIDRST